MKIIIYTCEVDNYDKVLDPLIHYPNIKFVCFTDNLNRKIGNWEFRPILSPKGIKDPQLINRYHKFLPHKFFFDTDWSVYIDANIRIVGSINELIDKIIVNNAIMACPEHPRNKNFEDEINACLRRKKISLTDAEKLRGQLEFYTKKGLPQDLFHTENSFMIRNHNDVRIINAMEEWWTEFNRLHVKRDQFSLPYIIWKHKIPFLTLKENVRQPNPYFYSYSHNKSSKIKTKLFLLKKYSLITLLLDKINRNNLIKKVRNIIRI